MRFHSRFALGVWFLAIAGFPALVHGQPPSPAPPSLGAAASFAVLGGSAVTSSGSTIVTGNLGVSPGNTVTGFPPGIVKVGDTFRDDATARAAQRDAATAYNDLASRTCTICAIGPNLGGLTLTRGVYRLSPSVQLTGAPLTLDAEGDPTAVWIFQIANAFTTAANSHVLTIRGGQAGHVFWQVGNSASLGANSTFLGNLFALTSITLNNRASVSGRLLALTGDVTLDTNNASLCCDPINLDPPTLPDGTTGTAYNQTITASGGLASYIFTVIAGSLPPGFNPLTTGGVLSGTPTMAGTFSFTVMATDSRGCSGTREYTIKIDCPPIFLSPPTLPDPTACVFYTQTITASGGPEPYYYSVAPGALPGGLNLDPTTGVLSGKATTPGCFTFTVTVIDANGCSSSIVYTICVKCNVTILPATLPGGTACVFYCQTLTACCGTPPYVFSVPPATLPSGLSLSPDGKLCGTPTTPGSSTFTVTATDAKGCTGSQTYTFPVVCNVTISPAALPNGSVSVPYNQMLTASCGTGPYSFKKVSGSLPPGFNPLTPGGVLSGTPMTAGVFGFMVMATDFAGCTATMNYTIFICPLTISPATLPNGTVGTQYSQTIMANDGSGLNTFSVPPGTLPPDLNLVPTSPTPGPTAVISGKPTTSGSFTFTVTAIDAVSGCVGSKTYTIVVICSLVLSPATLLSAAPGSPYSQTITASGGTAPYTFSVSSGALPPGLTLNTTTGEISGTPTAFGAFNFCITATDANPCTGMQCYTIVVAAGGPTLSAWGMIVLSILLVGAGFVMMRRVVG
jgi:Ice-binding-like/Putative Ig domain/IPTL-CTERM motif